MNDLKDLMAWQYEVANGDTRLGFDDWLEAQAASAAEAKPKTQTTS